MVLSLAWQAAWAEEPDFSKGKPIGELFPGSGQVYELPPAPPKSADYFAFDIKRIALAERKQAEKILGRPEQPCYKNPHGLHCDYSHGNQVTYINGRADWITIGQLEGMPFSPESLKALGLPVKPPTTVNDVGISWEGTLQGYRTVAFVSGGDRIFFAWIHVLTP